MVQAASLERRGRCDSGQDSSLDSVVGEVRGESWKREVGVGQSMGGQRPEMKRRQKDRRGVKLKPQGCKWKEVKNGEFNVKCNAMLNI